MPENQSQEVFDAIANEYDATFSHTAVGRLMRERVWSCTGGFSRRNPAAKAAGTALELNCGTGEDAIWLAKQGYKVLATDASPTMIAVTKAKIEQAGLTKSITAQVCSFTDLGQLPANHFELIFSNFGGLNCASPADLEHLGHIIAQRLKPGGKFIAVVMGRFCWWETLYFLLKRQPKEAFRRLDKKSVEARLDHQTTVPTWYYSPAAFQKQLQIKHQRKSVKPIGFWLPPSYLNPFFEKRPRLLGFLHFMEKQFAPSWLALASDHFLICIESPQS